MSWVNISKPFYAVKTCWNHHDEYVGVFCICMRPPPSTNTSFQPVHAGQVWHRSPLLWKQWQRCSRWGSSRHHTQSHLKSEAYNIRGLSCQCHHGLRHYHHHHSIISSCNMNKNDQNNIFVVIVSKTDLHGLPRSTSMQYLPPSCQVHFIVQDMLWWCLRFVSMIFNILLLSVGWFCVTL